MLRRDMAQLPGSIHFIAETPQTHLMRFGMPMTDAEISISRSSLSVAIFNPVASLLRHACAQVDREHRHPIHLSTQANVLICAKSVGLYALPGKLAHGGTFVQRTTTIFPMIARSEVASWVAHGRYI